MVSCGYCDDSTGELAFECNYCGKSFCQAHRLPEAHDCTHISKARPPTSAGDEPEAFSDLSRGATTAEDIDLAELRQRAETEAQPYSVVEVEHTVGTTPDPEYDSSPDVAVDGSIDRDSESTDGLPANQNTAEVGLTSINRTAIFLAVLFCGLILLGILLF